MALFEDRLCASSDAERRLISCLIVSSATHLALLGRPELDLSSISSPINQTVESGSGMERSLAFLLLICSATNNFCGQRALVSLIIPPLYRKLSSYPSPRTAELLP